MKFSSFKSAARGLAGMVLISACASHLAAQSPAGLPVRVNPTHDAHQFLDNLAVTPDGHLILVWETESRLDPPLDSPALLLLRGYSPDGIAGETQVIHREKGGCCFNALVATNAPGEIALIFSRPTWGGFSARRYGFPSGPRALWVETPVASGQAPQGIALDDAGGFVTVWRSRGQETTDLEDLDHGVFARRYDPSGRPVGPELHVNTRRRGDQTFPALAKATGTGAFVVVWQSKDQDGSGWGIYGRRFAENGGRLGGEFRVSSTTEGDQEHPAVAMDRMGGFVVAWTGPDIADPTRTAIYAQRFAADGKRLGDEIRVSVDDEGWESFARVAMDPHGNFAVSWDHWPEGLALTRLYRAHGSPVRAPVPLTRVPGHLAAQIAFAANGTFAAAWTDATPADDLEDVYAQRFSASPGTEACLFRHGEFVCDTGRTGGATEVRHPFGGEPGEVGMLGDLDGDGRADPCVFRDGVLRCDTEHDFGAAETRIRFGQAGDAPLLGDLDGDGRADPCVFRNGAFLCDTAHDGGAPEVEVAFGQAGDVPLLGDLDGDGKADPCVFRNGAFLCRASRNGEVRIAFGQAGDRPLLGDFDGDGRADPCVYRSGTLLCDTAHDGGAAEGRLTFGDGVGVPLLGNLDGL